MCEETDEGRMRAKGEKRKSHVNEEEKRKLTDEKESEMKEETETYLTPVDVRRMKRRRRTIHETGRVRPESWEGKRKQERASDEERK
jgi:hypothetical protein